MIRSGVFSGRFDPVNCGHLLTIEHLLTEYNFLLVPILDYPDREGCTAKQAQAIFEHHFNMIMPPISRGNVQFTIGPHHFGRITKAELTQLLDEYGLNFDNSVYLSGNLEVIDHIIMIGMQSRFVERVRVPGLDQFIFESTKIRKEMKETGANLGQIYNIK